MIKTLVTLSLILTTICFSAQMTPEEVVQKQLEAYNNRNIDSFMSVICDNITVHDFSTGKIIMKGYNACKDFYDALFEASPNLHSEILIRTLFGDKVIDHESIMGRNGDEEVLELVLIYEVRDRKIFKISVLKN